MRIDAIGGLADMERLISEIATSMDAVMALAVSTRDVAYGLGDGMDADPAMKRDRDAILGAQRAMEVLARTSLADLDRLDKAILAENAARRAELEPERAPQTPNGGRAETGDGMDRGRHLHA